MMVVLSPIVDSLLRHSGVGRTVPSFIEMYVSLLRLGLEQIDSGERSGPGRLSTAGLSLDEEGEHKPSAVGMEV